MEQGAQVVSPLGELVDIFLRRCSEKSTLDELQQLILGGYGRWGDAHALFDRIRSKTLNSIQAKNRLLEAQYAFEEICAKTLYNLTDTDAPFDPDSPYFVIPMALDLARALQISDDEIIQIVAPRELGTQS